jgi:hypothetical protein
MTDSKPSISVPKITRSVTEDIDDKNSNTSVSVLLIPIPIRYLFLIKDFNFSSKFIEIKNKF